MNRSLLCTIGAFALFCISAVASAAPENQPNIVLIISDDQDNEHFGFMGNETVRTPNLDELAAAGTVFNTCHLTSSRCRPSLAGLLSGRLPHQNGIYANYHIAKKKGEQRKVDGEKKLSPVNVLPKLLKEAGYATYGSGKYWEGDARAMGFTHGLETPKPFGKFARSSQDELFAFIDKHAGETPMFIWWAPMLPHTPHNPPERFLEMFDPEEIPVPDYITPTNRAEFIEKEHLSLAMEAWMDDEFGRTREKLKEKGQEENTLYVFLTDNGWCNGLASKGSVFEKGFRSPAFFTLPGKIPAGVHREDLISSLDLYPTILSYAGVKAPATAEGMNLRKAVETGTPVGRETLFGAIYPTEASNHGQFPERDVYALYKRTGKWKYVFYTGDLQKNVAGLPFNIKHILTDAPLRRRGDQNLYNLEADPYELNDLSQEPEHQAKLKDFRDDVFQWWEETGGAPIPESGKGTNHGGPQAAEKPAASAATKQMPKSMRERPNVLFIAIDDLRPELGCYGVDYIQSPRIDAFARTARLFKHHYVTAPTCGASRYALLTGLSPRTNHEAGNHAFKQNLEFTAQRGIESFPHLFKEAGYETISIGKICHGKQDTLPRSWSQILSPRGDHPDFQNNSGKDQRHAALGLDLPDAAYQDGSMTDTVIETLQTLKDKPFFFAVGFVKPHLPFWAPQKYFDLYDPKTIPQADWGVAPESPSYHPSFELMQQYGHHPEDGLENEEYRRKLKHGYAACVSFVDAQIGRILDELEALGLDENTIIVLWGDHGWHLGEHHLFGKHTSFERALKSPLIIRTPSMKNKGRSTSALVQSIDIYPTLAALCGLTPPSDIDGRPFLDLLDDPGLPGPEVALSYNMSYGAPFRGMRRIYAVTLRTGDYRYIQWQRDLGQGDILFQELYDHRVDPDEKDNLAKKKPELVDALSNLLTKYRSNK